ncbi:AAA family ATPase [bacterium]|nr:AAA family ATPase [bacterium]
MNTRDPISFPPFLLDPINEQVLQGSTTIELRPKTYAILQYLLRNAGRLVTKDELFREIWPKTFISDSVLKVCIQEIRAALQDDPKKPKYIETAHRRGYRFIGKITAFPEERKEKNILLMGRSVEMEQLKQAMLDTLSGERKLIFITGEPGIGKTTLIESFLNDVVRQPVWIAQGQCFERFGAGEPYMPVFEALNSLCRRHGSQLTGLLRKKAPTWLARMPGLLSEEDRELLHREMMGATREGMLREIGDLVRTISTDQILILVLEDLHWSDFSTVDFLTYLANLQGPLRLLIIGTYRPSDAIRSSHPVLAVSAELQTHDLCKELALTPLDSDAVSRYLALKIGDDRIAGQLVPVIFSRTGGNPFFMTSLVEYLAHHNMLQVDAARIETAMPDNVARIIEKQIEGLSDREQTLLEAASVAGAEFSTDAIAVSIEEDAEQVEEMCEALVKKRTFLRRSVTKELRDSKSSAHYTFIHVLYQDAFLARVPPTRRARIHQSIGRKLESIYADHTNEIAAELAMHFDRAGDPDRAVQYLHKAAINAADRFAAQETVALSRRALQLLKKVPESKELRQKELQVLNTMCQALPTIVGYGSAEVEDAYNRAQSLCEQLGAAQDVYPSLLGLWRFHLIRAHIQTAEKIARQLLRLARKSKDKSALLEAHWALGVTLLNMGRFAAAIEHLETGIRMSGKSNHHTHVVLYGHHPRVACCCFDAWALASMLKIKESKVRLDEALKMARKIGHPESLALALFFSAFVHQLLGNIEQTMGFTQELRQLSEQHALIQWIAFGKSLNGWALSKTDKVKEGLLEMQQAFELHDRIGTEISRPHFLALSAEILADNGSLKVALDVIDQALERTRITGGAYYEAELYRLKGQLLLRQANRQKQAGNCFRTSVEIARRQKSHLFELKTKEALKKSAIKVK